MLIGHFHDDNLVPQACRIGKDFGQWNNLPLCLMILFVLVRSKNIYTVYVPFCKIYLFVSNAVKM
jgi:hypothetical protein